MIKLDKINISRLQPILAQVPQLSRYRLLVIFPILLLVWMAQNAFDNLSDMGFFWLGLAGLLLFVVLPRPLFPPMEVEMPALRLAGKRRFWAGVAVSFISLPIMLHSVTEFFAVNVPEEVSDREPWQAFMWSVVFLIAGGLLMTRSNGQKGWWRSLTWGFFVILGLGIGLRLFNYGVQPLGTWFDETDTAIWARQMMEDPDYRPAYRHNNMIALVTMYGLLLKEFGITYIGATRLLSTLFGIGTIIGGYLVGREAGGNRFGLLFAFFLAVMRWSLNFSRIAMTGIDAAFFMLWGLYFVLRVGKTGALRDAMWAGLSLGAGMWFYTSLRPASAVLGVLLLWLVLRSRLTWPGRAAVVLMVGLYGAILIYPIAIYASQDWEGYTLRLTQVSIFEGGSAHQPGVPYEDIIEESMKRNFRMFTTPGDPNGRHNLAGEPMVDPVMGWLLWIGVVMMLLCTPRETNLTMAAVGLAVLLSASVTVPWEQPNGIRTLAMLPVVAYCCALAAYGLMRLSEGTPLRVLFQGGGLLGMAAITFLNGFLFFEPQRREYNNWASFDLQFTVTGWYGKYLPEDTVPYVSGELSDVSVGLISPEFWLRKQPLPLYIPLPVEPREGASVFTGPSDAAFLERLWRAYPNALIESPTPEDFGLWAYYDRSLLGTLFTLTTVSPEDIAAAQGVNPDGSGVLFVPAFGDYNFFLQPGTSFLLDGQPIQDQQQVERLAEGFHPIQSTGNLAINWLPPGAEAAEPVPSWYFMKDISVSNGLRLSVALGTEYIEANEHYAKIVPDIYWRYHWVPGDAPLVQRWKGSIIVPEAGTYTLFMEDNNDVNLEADEVQFFIEGRQLNLQGEVLNLEARPYAIDIYLYDTIKLAQPSLYWTPPGKTGLELVPQDVLRPYWP